MDQVIADAKALGALQVVCPILPHKAPLDRAQVLKAAANFNRYGAALKAAGLRFAYHNHAGDFTVTDSPTAAGETFYDVLIAATEPGVVSINIYATREEVHAVLRNPYSRDRDHHAGNNMALGNIRERLQLHFDAEASLSSRVSDDEYQVRIVMPYRKEKK